jgi:hypothetical protein
LGDSSLSGDISLSPTKGEGPLVRASSPTITEISSGLEKFHGHVSMRGNYFLRPQNKPRDPGFVSLPIAFSKGERFKCLQDPKVSILF